MALSKEFYLDEIRSKYPNSYNESLKDLPVKDLEDMLDFLDQALEKADGGSIGIEVFFGPKRGEYQTGGPAYDSRATAEDFAQAISKVGGGTAAQKLQDIGRYTTGQLGLTQQHFDNIAAMKSDPKKFGIDKQIDYAKLSGKDLVKGANPVLQPFVALGQGLASPIYDYYQALQKYSDKGYQGDFELSKKGILDFGKNLLRVGEEFAAQKPVQMAAGRTLGGLEAIQEGLSQFGTAAASTPSQLTSKPSQTFTADSQGYAAYQGIVPGFKAKKRSDGRFEYKAPDGQIYGPDTYTDIAAGKYPNIYDPNKQKKADGGRVGLFMGGPALTGQPLAIYTSMNAYGFSDQEIANAIKEAGYELPKTESTQPVTNTAPNIINQGGGDGGGRLDLIKTFDKGFSSQNFGLGPNKDVVDYEAEAYGIGPTFKGQIARAFSALSNIPTPFNIAKMGIQKAIDFANDKRERDRIAREKAAAELKAKQDIAAAEKKAREQNILNQAYKQQTLTQKQSGGGGGGQFDGASSKSDYDADPTGYSGSFNRGGLATMFTRRR